ncbi:MULTISPECIES: PDZ domain-containing protein [Kordiimonas]|uniref:PDZ domain-containing protein n=1 Tax=Kordiimonas TaxID=288021 RepID=UPI00257955F6|nr:PDZ domain-containing protein [Kordiimonas sp. UBA4487]
MIQSFLKTGLLATLLLSSTAAFADDLARRASWQARFNPQETSGMTIRELTAGSPLAEAGLRVGDTILKVNGQTATSGPSWFDMTDALVAGRPYELLVRRGVDVLSVSASFPPVALESHEGLETIYDSITSDYGIRQRVIITRPEGITADAPGPAIFVLQGLSCSSIEATPGRSSNYIRILTDLAEQSGMIMMRVEKPGMGDSEGNCSETGFRTELNGYEVALRKLQALPYVDAGRILVYGNSMGSALAPYFANKFGLNAVISDGTYYRTWFEHMLEIERRIKQMQGMDESTINDLINRAYIPLYYGMLMEEKSYADVIREKPMLAEHNYHGPMHMYGRPMTFYHQMQDFDVAGNWQKLKAPVRIRWGTNDWIMSEYDNDMIMEVLTAAGHENAELYKYPGMDHWATIHESPANSFGGKPGVWEDRISGQLVEWAKDLNSQVNALGAD